MQEKITLYEEMLALEPGSRLFFSLARLLVDAGEYDRAREVLVQGLALHPEFMEARLLLLDVLGTLGDVDTCLDETDKIVRLLSSYQGFWRSWETLLEKEGDRDSLVAMRFMRGALQGNPLRWMDVFEKGCEQVLGISAPAKSAGGAESVTEDEPPAEGYALSDRDVAVDSAKLESPSEEAGAPAVRPEPPTGDEGSSVMDEPLGDQDAEEVETISLGPDVSTRTMADLLVKQEEYEQALDIYEGLLQTCPAGPERQDLELAMDGARKKMTESGSVPEEAVDVSEPGQDDSGRETDEIVKTLSALADRLEERAKA